MRVVNLSRKPFVNRRPVVRLTVALWLLAAILLGINVTLYRDYWLGTAENRERLASAEQDIEEQLQELEAQDRALSQIRLKRQNRKATFLNSLIIRRTFPWSDLFDHLEEFTPDDVRLVTVNPLVKLATGDDRTNDATTNSGTSSTTEKEGSPANAVSLKLTGWAKSEEALATFVDTLYREPVFGPPLLQGEFIDTEGGKKSVRFNLETSFLIGESAPQGLIAESTPPSDENPQNEDELEATMATKGATLPDSAPLEGDLEDDVEKEATLARASEPPAPPPPSATAPPPSPPQQTAEEEESVREEIEAARQAARPPSREPTRETGTLQPPSRDRQQQLEALRARAVARRRTTRPPRTSSLPNQGTSTAQPSRNEPRNEQETTPPASAPPDAEDDDPTDINPPASSTPRVKGLSWRLPRWEHDFPPAPRSVPGWKEEMSA